jgi:hypothetical protein
MANGTGTGDTGEVVRIELTLTPGKVFTAQKCELCDGKCPPHPAVLQINRPLGDRELVLCARCDTAMTQLAALIGPGEATLRIVGAERAQTDMFSELERAAAAVVAGGAPVERR